MRNPQPVPRVPHSGVGRLMCEHRFEVAKMGQRYIPNLLICRQCGQKVHRKSARRNELQA